MSGCFPPVTAPGNSSKPQKTALNTGHMESEQVRAGSVGPTQHLADVCTVRCVHRKRGQTTDRNRRANTVGKVSQIKDNTLQFTKKEKAVRG